MSSSIKILSETPDLKVIPSNYAYSANFNNVDSSDPEESLPVVDFSLLTHGTPDQRSKTLHDLHGACQQWGFFMLINHGVPEALINKVLDAAKEFFDLTEEEKREFEGKHALEPIRCGSSFHNATKGKILMWRDYLKVFAHPEFHFPCKPKGFRELAFEYCERTREVARELLKGLWESLELEESYVEETLNLESLFQLFVANLYPPCPQPELAIGIGPHSDQGLLTLLLQNGVGGLQIQHNDKWVNVNALPNSFLVNVADQLEIFSNGKYKSVMHRAVVNNKETRISLVTPNGPSLDTIVDPSTKLVEREKKTPAYLPMKYKDYQVLQQNTAIDGILCIDRVKIKA